MTQPALWVVDPDTGDERPIFYSELEEDTLQRYFVKPVGGFVFPANLFMMKALPSVPFYVRDWLPKRGKSLLYAPAKSGKSYLCLQLARCVGAGEPFLGLPTTQGSVLYVQFELGEEILQARMRDTGKEYDNVWVGTTFSMKLDTKQGQAQLRKAMDAVEPNVLILDPKYKAIMGEEDKSTDMRIVCDFLDELIELYNCSILVIDHSGMDISKRNRGSTIWEDWVDSLLQMQRTSKAGETLKVKIKPIFLRHAQLPPNPIEAVMKNFEFVIDGDKEPTIIQAVAEVIKKSVVPVPPKALFGLGIGTNASVYSALNKLIAEGKIEKVGRGKYQWKLKTQ